MSVDFDEDDFTETVMEFPERPRVLVEGDSWFSFAFRPNVIRHIDRVSDLSILNLASGGDEIVSIMSGAQKKAIRDALREDFFDFKLLMFSGGGNDIVGEDLLPLLKRKPSAGTWEDCIHYERLERRIEQIRYAYLDLIDMRDDHRPDCVIVTHGYDYVIPSRKGVNFGIFTVGPWMQPYMEEKRIRRRADQKAIARFLIERLDDMLETLEVQVDKFVYVRTPGTLRENEWGDEIHPTAEGFGKIADKFIPELQRLFPDFVG